MFLKNAWYVAATPDEVGEKPLGRKILGERVVFYRGTDNKVEAVEDWCPHRGSQLSLGFVKDGNLVCGYHGLVMGGDGKCISMPGQRVRGFPGHPQLPGVRALRLHLGLGGRQGTGRPGQDPSPRLGREPRVGPRRRALPRQVRLPLDGRQPDGPDARDLRARHQHRPERDRGIARDHQGRGRRGHHQPLHGKHRRASVLARGPAPATAWPTTCRSTAGRSAASRRRAT